MSTMYHVRLDVPTRMRAEDAEAVLRAALDQMPWHADDGERHERIDDDVEFETRVEGIGADGVGRAQGRVRAAITVSKLASPVGSEWVDGREVHDPRIRGAVLCDALTRICASPVGAIVGSMMSEHGACMGPIAVTEHGVRAAYSHAGEVVDERFRPNPPPRHRVDRLPEDAVTLDARDEAGGWTFSIDRDGLRLALEDAVVDA